MDINQFTYSIYIKKISGNNVRMLESPIVFGVWNLTVVYTNKNNLFVSHPYKGFFSSQYLISIFSTYLKEPKFSICCTFIKLFSHFSRRRGVNQLIIMTPLVAQKQEFGKQICYIASRSIIAS